MAIGERSVHSGQVGVRPQDRRADVLATLADILIAAAEGGRRRVVVQDGGMVEDGAGVSTVFADELAEAIRSVGGECARHPHEDTTGRGVVLVDGSRPHADSPDVRIFLRTPPAAGARRHGDGERGADIVVDHHDARWPVIRHVSPALAHQAERLYLTETQAFFAARAFTWNEKFGDDLPAYERAVLESDVPPGSTVVDVGCGTGRAIPALRAAAGSRGVVIGVDVTPQMLTVAWQFAGQNQLLLADARRLPLASASVDVVFAAGLVQHLPDPAAGLVELARITRPGGRLIIFHPSGRAALAARHGRTLAADEPLAHDRLAALLAGSGWLLARYDDPPHRFYALAERAAS